MIPKIIHYCWFGGNPLPESAQKCIASWRRFFPDYEINEWNESNFDVNSIPYTRDAYQAKKYAFVSDYARFKILYEFGGVYFDTDVEVIKNMNDIIKRGAFMGIEVPGKNGDYPLIAPGLGIAVEAGHPIYKKILDCYQDLSFYKEDGSLNLKTVVKYNTEILQANGLMPTNEPQEIKGIWIYPVDYFNPLDDLTGKLNITPNTHSIHWYSRSWQDSSSFIIWLSRWSHRLFGLTLHNLKNTLFKKN